MSKQIHQSAAEKQRAYRDRLRAAGQVLSSAPKVVKPKRQSRPQRLASIEAAVSALVDEYQQWLDAIPENLSEGQLAEDLREVLAQLQVVADDLAAIDPPRIGLGKVRD